jgi:hypothetical protein
MALSGITFAVVGTGGHYADVDLAIADGEKSVYIKAGTSLAGWSHNVAAVEVETGPGVTITSGVNVTANNGSLILGPGSALQGELDVTTGVEFFFECLNGCALQNLDINTARCYINGGGWGTKHIGNAGIDLVSAADCIFENIMFSGSASGNPHTQPSSLAHRSVFRLILGDVTGSSSNRSVIGDVSTTPNDCLIMGFATSDANAGIGDSAIHFTAFPRARIIGNHCAITRVTSKDTVNGLESGGDDSVAIGNVVQDGFLSLLTASNGIAVGNRIDTTLTDSGTNNTTAGNDLTGF